MSEADLALSILTKLMRGAWTGELYIEPDEDDPGYYVTGTIIDGHVEDLTEDEVKLLIKLKENP